MLESLGLDHLFTFGTMLVVFGHVWRVTRDRRSDRIAREQELVERAEARVLMIKRIEDLERGLSLQENADKDAVKEIRRLSDEMAKLNTHVTVLCERLGRIET